MSNFWDSIGNFAGDVWDDASTQLGSAAQNFTKTALGNAVQTVGSTVQGVGSQALNTGLASERSGTDKADSFVGGNANVSNVNEDALASWGASPTVNQGYTQPMSPTSDSANALTPVRVSFTTEDLKRWSPWIAGGIAALALVLVIARRK